jgi:large subunit ribosomal protein L7/L12
MPSDINKICEQLSSLTVIEISQLSKLLQKEWEIDLSLYSSSSQQSSSSASVVEEKKDFDIFLDSAGENKIQVIKAVREITALGLKEAKDLVDGAPKLIKHGVLKDEADKIKSQLEASGAKVSLK